MPADRRGRFAGRCSPSCGLRLPASAATSRPSSRRRGGCWHPAEPPDPARLGLRRGPARAGADQPRHRRAVDRSGSKRRTGTSSRASPWRTGSGGLIWRSPAWRTGRNGVSWRSFPLGAERGRQAIELARRHGWTDEPVAGVAYLALGVGDALARGGSRRRSVGWSSAERTLRTEVEPAAGMRLHYARGVLEFAQRPSRRRAGRVPDGRAAGRACSSPITRSPCGAIIPAANPGADGRDTARRTGPGRDGRAGARQPERCATPWRHCGSPRTTRRRRRSRSRPSSTAPLR